MISKFGLMMILLGYISFVSKRNHLLMSLLSVEFLSMILFSMMIFISLGGSGENFIGLYYLIMSACEGVLGLSMIVIMSRGTGSDLICSGVILQC